MWLTKTLILAVTSVLQLLMLMYYCSLNLSVFAIFKVIINQPQDSTLWSWAYRSWQCLLNELRICDIVANVNITGSVQSLTYIFGCYYFCRYIVANVPKLWYCWNGSEYGPNWYFLVMVCTCKYTNCQVVKIWHVHIYVWSFACLPPVLFHICNKGFLSGWCNIYTFER